MDYNINACMLKKQSKEQGTIIRQYTMANNKNQPTKTTPNNDKPP